MLRMSHAQNKSGRRTFKKAANERHSISSTHKQQDYRTMSESPVCLTGICKTSNLPHVFSPLTILNCQKDKWIMLFPFLMEVSRVWVLKSCDMSLLLFLLQSLSSNQCWRCLLQNQVFQWDIHRCSELSRILSQWQTDICHLCGYSDMCFLLWSIVSQRQTDIYHLCGYSDMCFLLWSIISQWQTDICNLCGYSDMCFLLQVMQLCSVS